MKIPVSVPPRSVVGVSVMAYFSHPQTAGKGKGSDLPPLSTCEFVDARGAILSRTPIVGVPLLAKGGVPVDDDTAELILLVNGRGDARQEYDGEELFGHLAATTGLPIVAASADAAALPTLAGVLRSAKVIILDGVDPESFNLVQRDALVEYVRGGGTIVLPAPDESAAAASSWIAPLLPVTLVGKRQAQQVATVEGQAALKLRGLVNIVEAIEGDGRPTLLLRDRDYVHAAARSVGLGKVVFTSFPINALDPAQPQAATLWAQLLSLRDPRWDWNRSRLGDERHEVISSMIGRKVPPWGVAAGVAAGYLALIVAAQGLFFGARRPRAFVVSIVAAVIVSTALMAMGVVRRGARAPQAARLAILDLAPDGGGWRRESVAFAGADDPQMKLTTADESVMLRPALADPRNRPTIRQQPFVVENAQMFPDRIERVWEASKPLEPAWRITAAAQLGPGGVTLDVDNTLPTKIESPLVIWNGRALAMADLPTGRTSVRDMQTNARGQFSGLGVITSEQAKRRAQVIAASVAPASETSTWSPADAPPMLLGWIDDANDSLVAPVGRDGMEQKSMVMIRTPLRFDVAAAGSAVSVPAALLRVDTGRMPYDRERGESVPTPQGGSWEITFAPPTQTGRVKPDRVTVAARVTLPAHTIRLRMASRTSASEPVEWSRKSGAIETTFNCAAGDYDHNGRVRLMLEVESVDPTNTVPWQISDLRATMDGAIVGPPAPIVLEVAATTMTQPATKPADVAQEK